MDEGSVDSVTRIRLKKPDARRDDGERPSIARLAGRVPHRHGPRDDRDSTHPCRALRTPSRPALRLSALSPRHPLYRSASSGGGFSSMRSGSDSGTSSAWFACRRGTCGPRNSPRRPRPGTARRGRSAWRTFDTDGSPGAASSSAERASGYHTLGSPCRLRSHATHPQSSSVRSSAATQYRSTYSSSLLAAQSTAWGSRSPVSGCAGCAATRLNSASRGEGGELVAGDLEVRGDETEVAVRERGVVGVGERFHAGELISRPRAMPRWKNTGAVCAKTRRYPERRTTRNPRRLGDVNRARSSRTGGNRCR